MTKNFHYLLGAALLGAACSTTPAPSAPSHSNGAGAEPPAPAGSVRQTTTSAGCTLGTTRAADDGCNTCTCTEQGWACTELGCVDPAPQTPSSSNERVCTPGETIFVTDQSKTQVSCLVTPPDCGPGLTLGSEGTCFLCIPANAPPDRDSNCACNEGGQWVCSDAS